MHILHVVGARPNFVKAAAVLRALAEHSSIRQTLVHTGQHYDEAMSGVFFQQLEIRPPDVNLAVGSGTHAQQTAVVMTRFEPVLIAAKPDLVLVYGDVNSTVAAALVCAKLRVPVGHVEAGLRSRDRSMPEEINRLLADALSDLLFCPSADAVRNLESEGVAESQIHLVGNVMIDTLVRLLPQVTNARPADLPSRYALVTMHRPANVDDEGWLPQFIRSLDQLARELPVIFPVHPRTRQQLEAQGLTSAGSGVRFTEPLPYLEFLALLQHAALVITDSGGVQEETSFLGVPCLTMRDNTERPITVELGTNTMVGRDLSRLLPAARAALAEGKKPAPEIPLWDGHAAERIAAVTAGSA
jgi:UDP-N-acetylglucosamine 2-epimerase (non-hydrolysing)